MSDIKQSAEKNMTSVGLILMVVAVWDAFAMVLSLVNPTTIWFGLAHFSGGLGINLPTPYPVKLCILAAVIVASFAFGLYAFKGRASKAMAVACLVIGIVMFARACFKIVSRGAFAPVPDLSSIVSSLVAIAYFIQFRLMEKARA